MTDDVDLEEEDYIDKPCSNTYGHHPHPWGLLEGFWCEGV